MLADSTPEARATVCGTTGSSLPPPPALLAKNSVIPPVLVVRKMIRVPSGAQTGEPFKAGPNVNGAELRRVRSVIQISPKPVFGSARVAASRVWSGDSRKSVYSPGAPAESDGIPARVNQVNRAGVERVPASASVAGLDTENEPLPVLERPTPRSTT